MSREASGDEMLHINLPFPYAAKNKRLRSHCPEARREGEVNKESKNDFHLDQAIVLFYPRHG